jgi:hypothetical protein
LNGNGCKKHVWLACVAGTSGKEEAGSKLIPVAVGMGNGAGNGGLPPTSHAVEPEDAKACLSHNCN